MSQARSKESGMRKLWLGIVGLAAASTANAALVTYTMSLDDNGAGVPTAGQWAVYASVSSDVAGLYGFGVDLLPFQGTLLNRANGVVMENSNDGAQLNLGFTTGRTQDAAAGKFSGLGDLGAGAAMRPVYGIGQQPDDLDNYIPAEFDTQTAVFGAGRNAYGQETWKGMNMFLLGRGNYTTVPDFDRASVDTLANVYVSRTAGTANVASPIAYDFRDLISSGRNFVGLAGTPDAGTPVNVAVGDAITVTGSNGGYI